MHLRKHAKMQVAEQFFQLKRENFPKSYAQECRTNLPHNLLSVGVDVKLTLENSNAAPEILVVQTHIE